MIGVTVHGGESRGATRSIGAVSATPVAREYGASARVGQVGVFLSRTAPARIEITSSDGARSDITVTDPVWRLRVVAMMLAALLFTVTIARRLR